MAAWSDDLHWAPERYDRLESLLGCIAEGWYEEWDGLSVEPPLTGADGQGGTDAPTERAAA